MLNHLPGLSPLAGKGDFFKSNNSLFNRGNQANQSQGNGLNLKPNIQSADRFEVFNQILEKAYQRIAQNGVRPPEAAPAYGTPAPSGKISSEQAAGNILSFITQRLKADAANGASQEQLLERLDQGLAGFEQGFNEAKDQIEGLGFLTPGLADEIDDTYQRVTGGIEALRDKITQGSVEQTSASQLALSASRSESQSFSLSLTTQDGDTVTIDIARDQESSVSASASQNEGGASFQLVQQSRSASTFSLKVVGELDEGELTAINNLLEDVDSLASDFYQGNLDEAFNQALDINFDTSELARLDLNLTQTIQTRAIAAYQSNSPTPIQSEVGGLGGLLARADKLLTDAQAFAEPLKLVEDISQGLSQIDSADEQVEQAVAQGNQFSSQLSELLQRFLDAREAAKVEAENKPASLS